MKHLGGVLLALALLGGTAWGVRRWLAPPAVSAVYLEPEPLDQWSGISREDRQGLIVLLQEALELDAHLTVLPERPAEGPGRFCRIWKLSAQRRGDQLHLQFRDQLGTVTEAEGLPVPTLLRVFRALAFGTDQLHAFLPEDSQAFWDLVRLCGPYTFAQLKPRKAEAVALAGRYPASAAAWYRAAYASLRLLVVEASDQADAHSACDRLFQRTLKALPGYPRALYQYCRYRADVGSTRESLDLALDFRKRFPNHPLAYGALAYAARNAGLLEGAKEALAAKEALVGTLIADPGLGENTYLYLGDLDRFERSLASPPEAPPSPLRLFYLAYVRLLRGDREGALPLFRAARAQPGRVIQFEALAQVYECALTNRQDEALLLLRGLRDSRTQLRVPDGEFTFKLAEAFGFLGAHSDAIEAASSAFAQGFGCTRWYRNAPFLSPLQPLPRWRAQLKHIQDRENLLAARFPPRVFRRS